MRFAQVGTAARVAVRDDVAARREQLELVKEGVPVLRVWSAMDCENRRVSPLRIEAGRLDQPGLDRRAIRSGQLDFLRFGQRDLRLPFAVEVAQPAALLAWSDSIDIPNLGRTGNNGGGDPASRTEPGYELGPSVSRVGASPSMLTRKSDELPRSPATKVSEREDASHSALSSEGAFWQSDMASAPMPRSS